MDATQLILIHLQVFTHKTWPSHLRETQRLSLTYCVASNFNASCREQLQVLTNVAPHQEPGSMMLTRHQ